MPKTLQVRLATVLADIARTPEVRAKLFQQGWRGWHIAEGLANRIRQIPQRWGKSLRSGASRPNKGIRTLRLVRQGNP